MNWLEALTLSKEQSVSCVLVTIVGVEGSAPRDVGTRMVVTAIDTADTVGGGALENEVIQHARSLLINNARECVISEREFSLGSLAPVMLLRKFVE